MNWLKLYKAKSEKGRFEFIHHSTASIIEIKHGENRPDGSRLEIDSYLFNYNDFQELINFIKQLDNE